MLAMLMHWGMAALLVALVAMGWYMVRLPDAGFDRTKISLILAHKSLGIVALGLAMVRIVWRNWCVRPRLPDSVPDWQKSAAHFVHLCFYALMFALPVTGWLMSSAGGFPVYAAFDKLPLPDLIGLDPHLFDLLIDVHRWLGYALVGFLAVHVGGALLHHFVRRDDTLRKMLP
jgi:cytochrome b561